MQPFEFYKLAKDNLLDARLQQVANFLAEQNDKTSVVSIAGNLIKVDYKNNPYFNSYKYWLKPKSPLDKIMSKEFTINPLQDDDAFMQELTFTYNNRFNNESPISKKWAEAARQSRAISGKGKTLGDCKKNAEALGILKPEGSLNDIESGKYSLKDFKAIIDYHLTDMNEILKTKEMIKEELRGNKND